MVVITVGSVQVLNKQAQAFFILNGDSEMESLEKLLIILSVGDYSNCESQTQYFRVVLQVSQIPCIEVYLSEVYIQSLLLLMLVQRD